MELDGIRFRGVACMSPDGKRGEDVLSVQAAKEQEVVDIFWPRFAPDHACCQNLLS